MASRLAAKVKRSQGYLYLGGQRAEIRLLNIEPDPSTRQFNAPFNTQKSQLIRRSNEVRGCSISQHLVDDLALNSRLGLMVALCVSPDHQH